MLNVKNITFSYDKKPVLKQLSFNVKKGEHVSIIGQSGSGKSTLLKVLRGEYDVNEGTIFWNTTQILGPKYNLVIGYNFMKYVAQEFELDLFISVEEHIGKHLSNFYKKEKTKRVAELLDIVELSNFAKIKVNLLSGGQKQRAAIARALAKQPEMILLDEPFNHIDNFKKQSLRRRVFNYLKDKKITCLVTTHDKEDVLGYANRMLVIDQNKIVANASPQHLYQHPKTPLIASFFGEFNVIDDKIIYANQLQVVDNSHLKVVVKTSYFKGSHYLIEGLMNGNTVFFEHKHSIKKNTLVFLEIYFKTDSF